MGHAVAQLVEVTSSIPEEVTDHSLIIALRRLSL